MRGTHIVYNPLARFYINSIGRIKIKCDYFSNALCGNKLSNTIFGQERRNVWAFCKFIHMINLIDRLVRNRFHFLTCLF